MIVLSEIVRGRDSFRSVVWVVVSCWRKIGESRVEGGGGWLRLCGCWNVASTDDGEEVVWFQLAGNRTNRKGLCLMIRRKWLRTTPPDHVKSIS